MVETDYPNNRANLVLLCEGRSVIAVQKTPHHELSPTCLSSAVCDRDLMWWFSSGYIGDHKNIGCHTQHVLSKLQGTITDLSHSGAQMPSARVTEIFTVAHICGSSVRNVLHGFLLPPKILRFQVGLGKSEDPWLNHWGSTSLKRPRRAKVGILLGTASKDLSAISSLYLPAHHYCTVIKFPPFLKHRSSLSVLLQYSYLLSSHSLNYTFKSSSQFKYKMPPPLVQCITNFPVKSIFTEQNPRIHWCHWQQYAISSHIWHWCR